MSLKSIGQVAIGVVAVIGLVLGYLGYTKNSDVTQPVGSIPGNEVQGNSFTVGGLTYYAFYSGMSSASTTCSFRPVASSTLVRATAHVTNAQGGGFDLQFGKSNSVMATTTSLGYQSAVAAFETPTVLASSTPVNGGDTITQYFNAGQYLNIKIGSTSVSSGFRGTCSALFLAI